MSIANETRTNSPIFDNNVFDTNLNDIRHATSAKVPLMIEKGMQYLLRHPIFARTGIEQLTDRVADPAAQSLLEHMQPTEITNFIREKGRQAHASDFYALLENYRSADSICEAMLIGYLSKPAAELKKAGNNRERQQNALRLGNHVLRAFVEALYVFDDQEILQHVMQLFDEQFVVPKSTEFTIVDMMITNRAYQEPKKDAAEVSVVQYALNNLLKEHVGTSVHEKYMTLISRTISVKGDGGRSVPTHIVDKIPRITGDVWGKKIGQTHSFDFEESLNDIGPSLTRQIKQKRDYEPLVFSVLDIPLPLEIGSLVVKRKLDQLVTIFQDSYKKFEWRVKPAPNGRYIIIVGEPREMDEPETFLRIKAIIQKYVGDKYFQKLKGDLDPSVVNTIIEYLYLPIAPEKVQNALRVVLPEAQIGLHAIAERGTDNLLKRPKESFLRDMGITEIAFRIIDKGTQIITRFGKAEFIYVLDWNGNVIGLDNLSAENREWFMLVTLSFLRSQRHPDDHPIIYEEVGEKKSAAEEELLRNLKNDDEIVPSDARQHYLMVMPHGKVTRKGGGEIESKVLHHWKISLEDLNLLLMLVQRDKNELTNVDSYTNKYLVDQQYGQAVKRLLDELLDRIMHKATAPQWKMMPIMRGGQRVGEAEMLVPTRTYAGVPKELDHVNDYFMVVYVPEIHDPHAGPVLTQSPGVAEYLLGLANPISTP